MPRADPAATAVGVSAIAGQGLFAGAPIAAGEVVVDVAADGGPLARLGPVNHACDPNLAWSGAVTLVAARDIAAGEELTCDYSTSIDDPEFVLRCHCESTRCRQMVTGDDWQIPQLQQRYAGRWAPGLQRRIDAASR